MCLGLLVGCAVVYTQACNEAVCASLVSKCMLLKSCECNMLDKNNCTCCKDCHRCLAKLYTECCSCVGMCENKSPKYNNLKTSSVEELENPIPGLFRVLTEEPDPTLSFTTYTYPAHLDLLYFKPRGSDDFGLNLQSDDNTQHRIRHGHSHFIVDPDTEAHNCTVAYMSQCMSLNKCRQTCSSMGAARFRWFHEYGCCECIDSTCLDYGKGEALCTQCSAEYLGDDDDVENDVSEEVLYEEYEDLEQEVPPAQLKVAEEKVIEEVEEPERENTSERDLGVLESSVRVNSVDALDNL